jgi:alpha-tubulin suppressor-like RCC1 family protein
VSLVAALTILVISSSAPSTVSAATHPLPSAAAAHDRAVMHAEMRPRATTRVIAPRDVVSVRGRAGATQHVVLGRRAHVPPIGGSLVVPATGARDGGVLGAVVARHRRGDGRTNVVIVPAALAQAYSTFKVSIRGTLADLSEWVAPRARSAALTCLAAAAPGKLVVDPSRFSLALHIDADRRSPYLSGQITADPRLSLDFAASGPVTCTWRLGRASLTQGPLRVTFQPSLILRSEGALTLHLRWHPQVRYRFTGGRGRPRDDRQLVTESEIGLTGGTTAHARLDLAVRASVGGRDGLRGSIGPEVNATTNAKAGRCGEATGVVRYGLQAFGGAFVDRWTVLLTRGLSNPGELAMPCPTAPPAVAVPTAPRAARAIAAGESHTCAVLVDGTAKCWGYNDFGQLGNGTTSLATPPVTVSASGAFTAIAAGGSHTCALTADGRALCWGRNFEGQLGDGTNADSSVPVAVSGISNAVAVATGHQHSCAVLAGGQIRCWGHNDHGQLGDGTMLDSDVPVAVDGITDAVAVSVGYQHSCAVLVDGTVACWGANERGQLGDGTTTAEVTPVLVSGLSTAVAVAAGGAHACAVLQDGDVACWGAELKAAFDDFHDTTTPVLVDGVTNATGVVAGGAHACAPLTDGHVACWGENAHGDVGNGNMSPSSPAGPVKRIGYATLVAAGQHHSCAAIMDGTIFCWGSNAARKLGADTASTGDPVMVGGL